METEIEINGKKYEFTGDPSIKCKCMSNGRKCDQRNLDYVETYPFTQVAIGEYLCTRVWKEVVVRDFTEG